MFFPIYLANLDCTKKNHNSPQSKVAEELRKNMGNQAKLKITFII